MVMGDFKAIYRKQFYIASNKFSYSHRCLILMVIHRFVIEGGKTDISKISEI